MRIVFMGTPAFAVPSLRALIARHDVVAVCTQPDRPAGRGHKLTPSPVKTVAEEHGIPVLQPATLRLSESREIRATLQNFGADVFVVAAYGLLLPKGVLKMPKFGCINVHASLLPAYRGASPIHAALLNGDTETGITIMHMDVGLDTGNIILQKSLLIAQDERFPQLHDRMADLGGELILEALTQIENNTAPRIPQDDTLSSYAPMIQKADGHINWSLPTQQIINLTRALDPWPGCYTMYNGQSVKIWQLEEGIYPVASNILPGTVLSADSTSGLVVKTGDGAAIITELQALGSKRMPTKDYLRGREILVGAVLG